MENKKKHILDYLDKTGQKKSYEKELFQVIFDCTLKRLCLNDKDYEVSLSLIDEEEMHELNLQYRNIDRPTDVLTFAYREADFNPEDPVIDLGSILIAPSYAKRQAKEYHHPYERELAFLFIHGLLHIFGYDHHTDNPKDAEVMFALQNEILNSLPIDFYTNKKKLKELLLEAQSGSYSPYSHFKVGAVVVTKDGKYHKGFNIENSAYTVSVCAERVALFSCYAKGYHKEDIVSLGCITQSEEIGTPCGVCRQAMSELMNPNCKVYIYNKDESKELVSSVEELLPYAFTKENLNS